jgi:hypothetical protein
MRSFCSLVAFFGLASIAAAAPTPEESFISKRVLQPLPLSTTDRWIIDASGAKVPFVGINWPGAADTMVPEGLQYQSIVSIVGKIAETGFNAVRLTFAIEMVDDILDNGGKWCDYTGASSSKQPAVHRSYDETAGLRCYCY